MFESINDKLVSITISHDEAVNTCFRTIVLAKQSGSMNASFLKDTNLKDVLRTSLNRSNQGCGVFWANICYRQFMCVD